MSRLIQIICVVSVLGLCIAEPVISKRKSFARQEALPDAAPTGYPAAGFTPEIPFELPSESTPETTYLPPAETTELDAREPVLVYGPPQNSPQEPVLVYGPPQNSPQEPVLVYGPPQNDAPVGDVPEDDDAVEAVVAVSGTFDQQPDAQPARLRGRPAKLQLIRGKPDNYVYTQTFQRF